MGLRRMNKRILIFKLLLLISLLIFSLGCITQPKQEPSIQPELTPATSPIESPTEKITAPPTPTTSPEPKKPIEIKLTFPNGTVEKNGTYFLGEFTENFTFKIEPEDAKVYFNDFGIDAVNGTFTISVKQGGNYTLRVIKDKLEKVYNISIGHGEIKAEWIKTELTYVSNSFAGLVPDEWCLTKGNFRVFYEDRTNTKNRTILGIRRGYGSVWFNITTDENGIGSFNVSTAHSGLDFEFVDETTNKTLLKAHAEICPVGEA